MTANPLRSLPLIAVALLALAGCAVPGKGEPGVVAVYHDREITDADITAIRLGMNELCSGPNSGEDLTLLLLGPEVVALAEDLGYGMTDEQLATQAEIWVSYENDPLCLNTELTTGALEVVRVVQYVAILMHEVDGTLALIELVTDIDENATVSPRYGDFTLESFIDTIRVIEQDISDNTLVYGPAQFVAWKEINGFSVTDQPDWISGE